MDYTQYSRLVRPTHTHVVHKLSCKVRDNLIIYSWCIRTVYGQFGRRALLRGYYVSRQAQVFAPVVLPDVRNHQIAAVHDAHPKQTLQAHMAVTKNPNKRYTRTRQRAICDAETVESLWGVFIFFLHEKCGTGEDT